MDVRSSVERVTGARQDDGGGQERKRPASLFALLDMARKSARTAEGAVAPVPVEVLSSTIVSPFSTLRAHLARALQEALLQLVARRAALPANALLSPLAPAQVQAIVDRVEESCEGLLRSEAAPGVEEEPWRRDCRRNIVYSALEELLFEVVRPHAARPC